MVKVGGLMSNQVIIKCTFLFSTETRENSVPRSTLFFLFPLTDRNSDVYKTGRN